MLHSPSPAEAVQAAIASLGGTLELARALLDGGRRIDLAGLDAEAARLCAAVLTLTPEAARPLRPALERLRRQVDGLAAEMARR